MELVGLVIISYNIVYPTNIQIVNISGEGSLSEKGAGGSGLV
jgi:hypothetical protein